MFCSSSLSSSPPFESHFVCVLLPFLWGWFCCCIIFFCSFICDSFRFRIFCFQCRLQHSKQPRGLHIYSIFILIFICLFLFPFVICGTVLYVLSSCWQNGKRNRICVCDAYSLFCFALICLCFVCVSFFLSPFLFIPFKIKKKVGNELKRQLRE